MRKVSTYLLLGAGLSAAGVFAEGDLDRTDTESREVAFKAASSLSLGAYKGTDPNTGEMCTVLVRDQGKYYFAKDRVKMLEITVIGATKDDPYAGLKTGNVTQVSLGQPPEISSGTDAIPVDPPASLLRQFAGVNREGVRASQAARTLPNPVAHSQKNGNNLMLETRSLSYRYREDEDSKPSSRSRDKNGDIVRQTGAGTALNLVERVQRTSIDLKTGGLLDRITIDTRKGTSKLIDSEMKGVDPETKKPFTLSSMSNKAFQAWKKDENRPTEAKGEVKDCQGLERFEEFSRTWTELEPKAPTITPPPAAEAKPEPKPTPVVPAPEAKPVVAPAPVAKPTEAPKPAPQMVALHAQALALTPPVVKKKSEPKAEVKKVEKEKEAAAAEPAPVASGPHTEAAVGF